LDPSTALSKHFETKVTDNMSTLSELDYDSNSAFDLALKHRVHSTVLLFLLQRMMPCRLGDDGEVEMVPAEEHCYAWIALVSHNDNAGIVDQFLKANAALVDSLANVTDANGKTALACSSVRCGETIQRNMYFMGRYEFLSPIAQPHHRSVTCSVYLAIDHDHQQESTNSKARVALKLMKNADQFLREIEVRKKGSFNSSAVVQIYRTYDSKQDPLFVSECERKGILNYAYCIVMPAADRSLKDVIEKEFNQYSSNLHTLHGYISDILHCVDEMHRHGYIHGDIKPLNICRVGQQLRLIDLDASCRLGKDYAGLKLSSAFLPPEMIYLNAEGKPVMKRVEVSQETGEPVVEAGSQYIMADYSYDMWSIGMTLYRLLSDDNMPFFLADRDDNIDTYSMLQLYHFSDSFKNSKLERVADPKARNLISQLLMKNPKKRPTCAVALKHPFQTGAKVSRMMNESPEFDVFISYRVSSDSAHALELFDVLTAAGMKVWLDQKVRRFVLLWWRCN
jgi:serine/threonine protein kinase